jgi:hypothetical protein
MFYKLRKVKVTIIHPNGWCACLKDRILRDLGGTRTPPGSLASRFPPRTG